MKELLIYITPKDLIFSVFCIMFKSLKYLLSKIITFKKSNIVYYIFIFISGYYLGMKRNNPEN